MKIRVCLLLFLMFSFEIFLEAQTAVLLQENFTAYLGTSATVPAGWNFSYNGNYTTSAFSGASGPNSYKFGANNATIITPSFANADSVSFWIKGAGTDTASYLSVYETPDSITWNPVVQIKPVPTGGTAFGFPVNSSSIHLKFFYSKSVGNLAFDDLLVTRYTPYISSGDVKIYFTHPVNNSVSGGVNAVYLNQTIDDTLIEYINRAKYTLDIAMYNYAQTGNFSNIAAAINNAYNRGVKIRWIYSGTASNTGLSSLDTNIKTLGSPNLSNYGIMHNKFMIADAKSSDGNDAIVWTGSCNWTEDQINSDANNTIIIQDKYLATAYIKEFEEMWGDTGLVPNSANSKFGSYKTDNTQHIFNIKGRTFELYFSPSDNTNDKIISSISTANSDLYFGVYAFTVDKDADSIKTKIQNGIYAAGILDPFSQTYSAYTTLQSVMGNNLKVYANAPALYHNKFLIVDECDSLSDPMVLTGSHNWSSIADTKNDENTLIIHDDTIANIYYQSFHQNFLDQGGTLPSCSNLGIDEIPENAVSIYPNPSQGKFQISMPITFSPGPQISGFEIYNFLGEKIYTTSLSPRGPGGGIPVDISGIQSGIYFLNTITGGKHFTGKIIIQR